MRLVVDLESDGLLLTGTKVHCLVLRSIDTDETFTFVQAEILRAFPIMEESDLLVAHNGIGFDFPFLEKIYGWKVDRSKVFDTAVVSRLIFSMIKEIDIKSRARRYPDMPPKLIGSHSLKAWGYRLGNLKGEFGETNDWSTFTPEMLEYCVQDCEVTKDLFLKLEAKQYSERAIKLEHDVAWVLAKMYTNGFCFNVKKAQELHVKLIARKLEIEGVLQLVFPPKIIERYSEKTGKRLKDSVEVFNPGSRDQIAARLKERYGWEAQEWTDSGKPKIDESVLGGLEYPEAKILTEYLMLAKRLGQLSDGNNAWLKLEREGKIHGGVIGNGAVTGRATHNRPNMGQVPSSGAPYGKDCRELFEAPEGWVLVGTDASGLELRCLAHYMSKWDDGAYGNEVLNGDIHTTNQHAAGLPTRPLAKTFIYGFLYGAGDGKIGSIVGGTEKEGKALKRKFLKSLPSLKLLLDLVKETVKKRGHLVGLDGRHLHVRSDHAALNVLLQSAGALLCKYWLVDIDRELQARGFKHGWDGDYAYCMWIHDELQIAARTPEIAQEITEVSQLAMRRAQEYFSFRCQLDTDSKVGLNWSMTH